MDPQEPLTPAAGDGAKGLPFGDEELCAFLATLRNEGYRVGAGQVLGARHLLDRLQQAGMIPENPRGLARYLGPLLCSSPAQQHDFQRRFDVWVGPMLAPRAAPDPAPAPSTTPIPASTPAADRAKLQEELQALRRRTRLLAAAGAAGALLLLFGVVSFLDTSRLLTPLRAGLPLQPRETRPWILPFAGALEYGVAALTLLVAVVLWRRRFLVRRYASDLPDLSRFTLSRVPAGDWLPQIARDVAVRMRKRELLEDETLDIPRTVEACAAAAGYFTPVYVVRSRIPEYLVLIDQTSPHDLRAVRARALVDRLVADGVYAAVYLFDGDPRRVVEARRGARPMTLSDLQSRHPGHRLVVCAEAGALVSGVTGAPYGWMSLFGAWDDRSLLTLVPIAHWGTQERAVSSMGFKVLPCTPDGFGAVADTRLARRVAGDAWFVQPPRYPPALAGDEMAWMDPNRPAAFEVEEMLGQVRRYLGETGCTWLAACAVYPEINPLLTLHLGSQVAGPYQAAILERLARLPWMRRGYIPDWLRRALLDELHGRRERDVRAVLRTLLLSPQAATDGAVLEVARGGGLQFQRLWRWSSRAWREHLAPGEPLRDHVFVSWMDNRLALRVPRALMRWLRDRRRATPPVTSDTLTPDTAHSFEPVPAFPARGLVQLLIALAIAVLSGAFYGALTHFIRGFGNVVIGWLVLGVTLYSVYALSESTIRDGRVRGGGYGTVVGLLVAGMFLYANWAVWIALEPGMPGIVYDLRVMFQRVPSPVLWGTEALLVALFAIIAAHGTAVEPFCTTCQRWTKKHERVYGPLTNEDAAVREILHGRYTPVFALSTTAPDAARATVAKLEHCDPSCGAVTLLTLASRHSERAPKGLLRERVDRSLLARLFVPRHAARAVVEWVVATPSIQPNLAPTDKPELHRIVGALLGLSQTPLGQLYIYGDIPVEVADTAREKLKLPPDAEIAALLVEKGWFLVSYYKACVFTERGLFAHNGGATIFTEYSVFAGLRSEDRRATDNFLASKNIGVHKATVAEAIGRILQFPSASPPEKSARRAR